MVGLANKTNLGLGSDYLTENGSAFLFCKLKIFLYEEGCFTGAFSTLFFNFHLTFRPDSPILETLNSLTQNLPLAE